MPQSDEKLFDAPNLDGLTANDPAVLDAAAEVLELLATYATLKASAMRYRLEGHINTAMHFEKRCAGVYQQLPKWARW